MSATAALERGSCVVVRGGLSPPFLKLAGDCLVGIGTYGSSPAWLVLSQGGCGGMGSYCLFHYTTMVHTPRYPEIQAGRGLGWAYETP